MAFLSNSTKETQPAGSSPERIAAGNREAVVTQAVALAMGSTLQYVDYRVPPVGHSEANAIDSASRIAPVNISGVVNNQVGQEQMAA